MQQTTESAGRGRTVVVVEDNVRSRRLVRDLLELHGFRIVEAETAEEALEADPATPAPTWCSWTSSSPGWTAWRPSGVLRADPAHGRHPGGGRHRLRHAGRRGAAPGAGFDAYIAKPIDTRAFVPRLLAVLEARGG